MHNGRQRTNTLENYFKSMAVKEEQHNYARLQRSASATSVTNEKESSLSSSAASTLVGDEARFDPPPPQRERGRDAASTSNYQADRSRSHSQHSSVNAAASFHYEGEAKRGQAVRPVEGRGGGGGAEERAGAMVSPSSSPLRRFKGGVDPSDDDKSMMRSRSSSRGLVGLREEPSFDVASSSNDNGTPRSFAGTLNAKGNTVAAATAASSSQTAANLRRGVGKPTPSIMEGYRLPSSPPSFSSPPPPPSSSPPLFKAPSAFNPSFLSSETPLSAAASGDYRRGEGHDEEGATEASKQQQQIEGHAPSASPPRRTFPPFVNGLSPLHSKLNSNQSVGKEKMNGNKNDSTEGCGPANSTMPTPEVFIANVCAALPLPNPNRRAINVPFVSSTPYLEGVPPAPAAKQSSALLAGMGVGGNAPRPSDSSSTTMLYDPAAVMLKICTAPTTTSLSPSSSFPSSSSSSSSGLCDINAHLMLALHRLRQIAGRVYSLGVYDHSTNKPPNLTSSSTTTSQTFTPLSTSTPPLNGSGNYANNNNNNSKAEFDVAGGVSGGGGAVAVIGDRLGAASAAALVEQWRARYGMWLNDDDGDVSDGDKIRGNQPLSFHHDDALLASNRTNSNEDDAARNPSLGAHQTASSHSFPPPHRAPPPPPPPTITHCCMEWRHRLAVLEVNTIVRMSGSSNATQYGEAEDEGGGVVKKMVVGGGAVRPQPCGGEVRGREVGKDAMMRAAATPTIHVSLSGEFPSHPLPACPRRNTAVFHNLHPSSQQQHGHGNTPTLTSPPLSPSSSRQCDDDDDADYDYSLGGNTTERREAGMGAAAGEENATLATSIDTDGGRQQPLEGGAGEKSAASSDTRCPFSIDSFFYSPRRSRGGSGGGGGKAPIAGGNKKLRQLLIDRLPFITSDEAAAVPVAYVDVSDANISSTTPFVAGRNRSDIRNPNHHRSTNPSFSFSSSTSSPPSPPPLRLAPSTVMALRSLALRSLQRLEGANRQLKARNEDIRRRIKVLEAEKARLLSPAVLPSRSSDPSSSTFRPPRNAIGGGGGNNLSSAVSSAAPPSYSQWRVSSSVAATGYVAKSDEASATCQRIAAMAAERWPGNRSNANLSVSGGHRLRSSSLTLGVGDGLGFGGNSGRRRTTIDWVIVEPLPLCNGDANHDHLLLPSGSSSASTGRKHQYDGGGGGGDPSASAVTVAGGLQRQAAQMVETVISSATTAGGGGGGGGGSLKSVQMASYSDAASWFGPTHKSMLTNASIIPPPLMLPHNLSPLRRGSPTNAGRGVGRGNGGGGGRGGLQQQPSSIAITANNEAITAHKTLVQDIVGTQEALLQRSRVASMSVGGVPLTSDASDNAGGGGNGLRGLPPAASSASYHRSPAVVAASQINGNGLSAHITRLHRELVWMRGASGRGGDGSWRDPSHHPLPRSVEDLSSYWEEVVAALEEGTVRRDWSKHLACVTDSMMEGCAVVTAALASFDV